MMGRWMAAGLLALVLLGQGLPALAQTTVEYIHTDALGSPVAVTNQAGQVIERDDYEPYGAMIGKPDYQGIGYTGHVQDAATGLTYMQQRYYDPQLGLFLSVDPVTAYSDPVGQFHRYRYANNNPYKFIDPDGRAVDEPERTPRDNRSITSKCLSCAGQMATSARPSSGLGARGIPSLGSQRGAESNPATTTAVSSDNSGGVNWPKRAATALRVGNSARLGASGLLKLGVGGAESTSGVGALPGVPTMMWGMWNIRSSANNYMIAGQLYDESRSVEASNYSWGDRARVALVGGLLPYGTLADDPGEPMYHQMIFEKAKSIKDHPMEFIIEMGSVSP